jgi:hypothetical protein
MDSIETQLKESYLGRLKADSEEEIRDERSDFMTRYYALHHLYSVIVDNPDLVDARTISILRETIKDSRLAGKRQHLFYCRIAAETLCSIMVRCKDDGLHDLAFSALKNVMANTTGYGHRAATEALTGLPLSVRGPDIAPSATGRVPAVTWCQFISEAGHLVEGCPVARGRSIVAPIADSGAAVKLLVAKLARCGDDWSRLLAEAQWLIHFKQAGYSFPLRFDIPEAVKCKGSYLFRLSKLPAGTQLNGNLHPEGYAIGFVADRDYFQYPNDSKIDHRLDIDEFKEVLFRNAWLMGRLAARGIIHMAPIPLFHNRVQINRRRDRGLYEWFRAGRLDRWLESCAYPNMGATGIRDFEHLDSFKGSNLALYRHIGNHFLSLLLLAGSYFRNKAPEMVGYTANGKPVDTRFLFDLSTLETIVCGVFQHYYEAFVGTRHAGTLPIDTADLCRRMIEEMGVDRYMEESLRVVDQNEMTEEDFKAFLVNAGSLADESECILQGVKDILIYSGPHLGAFNRQISLPELVESVATMSALCLAGKFISMR